MGDLVSVSADIETVGNDFSRCAGRLDDALTKVRQASDHVRRAFHNHPEREDAAVAPFMELHGSVAQVQELVSALAASLNDVATSYRNNDNTVAKGWERATRTGPRHGEV